MLLVGDVGGTKTLLGLFRRGRPRPEAVAVESFRTLDFGDLASLIQTFLRQQQVKESEVERACFGVAGPVKNRRARLTNVPWDVDADLVTAGLGIPHTDLLNDLEALAWAVPVLQGAELHELWRGEPQAKGGSALIAAGTGLGIALLPNVDGRLVPTASEGGHADFAARTDRERVLQAALVAEVERAELEHVLSGPGLVNIHRLVYPHTCAALKGAAPDDLAAHISSAALGGTCSLCRQTLELFVSAYGACAGNLALTALSTGGIFLGGGIAPRILDALAWPVFLESFFDKAPMQDLVRRIPVNVILNTQAGLLGAAHFAASA